MNGKKAWVIIEKFPVDQYVFVINSSSKADCMEEATYFNSPEEAEEKIALWDLKGKAFISESAFGWPD